MNNKQNIIWLILVVCMLTALSSSAAVVYFTGASGVDNNFSTAGNWSAYPADGDQFLVAVTNANGIATAANNPAVIDSGFTNRFGGTAAIYSAAGYGAGTAYAEVASGGVLWCSTLAVGYYSGGAYDGTLTLRTGGSITNAFLNAGVFAIGGDVSGREGYVIVESGAALFQQTSLSLNTYGTLQFKFGADSVSTLTTTRSTAGATNLLNGLVQVDLSALTTAGTYTLIDSSSANLLIGGAMRTWLDGQGGSYSNTGNYANTNFAVLNAGNAEWALSPADGNQDLIFTVIPKAMQSISPNDPNIHISGAQYITRGTNSVSFQRHSDYVLGLSQAISRLNPLKARTTTGVILTFKTDSRTIEMSFRMLDFDNLDSGFGVYQDGVLIAEHTFVKDIANPDQILTITSVSPGTASVFEVVMPSKSNTELFGMRIGGDASLLSYTPPVRKKYVAFGDSITHGTGQEPYSHWIYPFKLSRELGVELFNIAVGGSQVSSVCGEMMADFPPVDVITILWGYNDWRANVSKVDYQTRMDDLIAAIRGHQATAEIFCITPTYSTNTNSPDGNTTLDDYRQAVADLVASRQAAGDSRIHTVRGEEIIYFATQLKDPVHLTPDGATDMANGLFTAMDPIVNPLTFAGWTTQKGLSGADTNYFADPDGDGINNLLEYATGGNPASTNDSPDIFRLNPAGWSAADTNGVEFTSRRQRYATAKGLIYQLERTDDLISGIWETNGVEETGTAMIDENYEWVSNRVVLSTNETGFVRMRISITP